MSKHLQASHGVIPSTKRMKQYEEDDNWYYLPIRTLHIYYKHPVKSDVTFIVQGRIKEDIFLKLVLNLLKFGQVILSTWEVWDQTQVMEFISDNEIPNGQNVYLQVYSTLKGLEKCETEYAIKVRADEWYNDFTQYIQVMKESSDKITTHNMFFRKIGQYPYHISDHIIGGRTENLCKMFSMCKKNLEERKSLPPIPRMLTIIPEQWLTVAYLRCFYDEDNLSCADECEIKEKMIKNFKIVPVDAFRDFTLSYTWHNQRQFITGTRDLDNHSHAFGITSIDMIDT